MTSVEIKFLIFPFFGIGFSVFDTFLFLGCILPSCGTAIWLACSFLMIFVPFLLSLIYAWKENGKKEIVRLFKSILYIKKADTWAMMFCIACMPLIAMLTYLTMKLFSLELPAEIVISLKEIALMVVLYFFGAIPEEFGWTYTLTHPLTKAYGPVKTGFMIGAVWALWHVIPWSWAHPAWWIVGMCVLNVLMRTAMVYAYMYGGESLFTRLIFHTMINVSMGIFPNNGSHINTWLFSLWMAVILLLLIFFFKTKGKLSNTDNYISKRQ